MLVIAVLSLSVAIQLTAAWLALRMTRTSGGKLAWVALAGAILLMAVRRSVSLGDALMAYPAITQNLQTELIALVISGLMLAGILNIRPLFEKLRQSEKALKDLTWRNKTILETSPDGFCIVDIDGNILEMNTACSDMLGIELHDDRETSLASYVVYPNRTKFKQAWRRIIKAGEGRMTIRYQLSENDIHDLELTAKYVHQDTPAFVFLFIRDVTEQKQAEHLLHQEKEQAQVTLEAIGDGVITTDPYGNIQFMNHIAEGLTGHVEEDAKGQHLSTILRLKDEFNQQPLADPTAMCCQDECAITLKNVCIRNVVGVHYSLEITVSPLHSMKGDITGTVLVMHDVTELKQMADELSYQASHDPLTGLVNRREFESRLEHALEEARYKRQRHVLCYIDLDQFKVVNDTCGHVAGDELLKQISHILESQVRETDTLARLGGDEFGVLLMNCHMQIAEQVAKKFLKAISEVKFVWEDNIFEVGASIGLVEITEKTGSMTDVLSSVDSACYVVKEQGRNGIHVYAAGDQSIANQHGQMKWLNRLRRAIDMEQFRLYAQEIHPLYENNVHNHGHTEILLRMVDEDNQIILPNDFLPTAERYNLMPTLDRWVVREALLAINEGSSSLIANHQCSINLSGQSLGDESFLDEVLVLFKETGVEYERICFEITETAMIGNINFARDFITTLRQRGCKFSLDDFGSGFSSFKYLKSLPVDYLKIDGCFVHGVVHDDQDYNMVKSIHQIGQYMGIHTIAEYVENEDILRAVTDIGIEYGQGYALGKPLPLIS